MLVLYKGFVKNQFDRILDCAKIVAQGVIGFESSNGSMKEVELAVTAALAGASRQTLAEESLLKEHLRLELKRFVQKETGAKPVIVPIIQKI